jgi:hypothetical protein
MFGNASVSLHGLQAVGLALRGILRVSPACEAQMRQDAIRYNPPFLSRRRAHRRSLPSCRTVARMVLGGPI